MRKIYTKIGVIALLLSSLTAYSQQQRISESQIQPVKEKLKQLGEQNPLGMFPIDKLSKEETLLWRNYQKQILNDRTGTTAQNLKVKTSNSEVSSSSSPQERITESQIQPVKEKLKQLGEQNPLGMFPVDKLSKEETVLWRNYQKQIRNDKVKPSATVTPKATTASDNAFANVIYEPITSITGFGKIPLTPPNVFELIEANAISFFADDLASDGNLYAVDNGSKKLAKFYNDGTYRYVGNLTNIVSGHTVTGLSWNPSNNTLYLVSTNGTAHNLYTVDLATGVATSLSSISAGAAVPIWLEIDNNGNAFFADITGDSLYSLNLTTGVATLVGALGIDISYAQDADFDKDTNTLYMAGYQVSGESGIYTVNTSTGAATFIGTTDGAELGTFTITDTLPDAPPVTEYCELPTPSSTFEYITNVTFAGINNDSAGSGSIIYDTPTGNVVQGETVPFSVTIHPDGSEHVSVFFDWNHDFDFSDSGERYDIVTGANAPGPHTVDILVPADAVVGETVMRVVMRWNASPDPCTDYGYGEVEQYTVNVTGATVNANNAFANVIYEPITSITGFGKIPLTPPNVFELIEANSNSFFADDLASDGNLYAVDNGSKRLVKFYNDGTYRIVGNLTNIVSGHTVTGLSWNSTNNTLYLVSTNGTANNLYTVNLATGVATSLSSISAGAAVPIWLEIDNNGNAFFADITGDSLYSLNLTTGVATLVGALGIDISYAQDADFDKDTNTLYMAGYQVSGESGIYTVNTSTGAATFIGTTDGAELGTFTITDTLPDAPPITEPCPMAAPNSGYEFITNVTFAGINNDTGGDSSTSYSTPVGVVEQGATVPISVTIDPDGSDNLTVYFDWNHDFDFNDEGEKVVLATLTSSPGPFTQDIVVPAGAVLGETTMRVVLTWLYDTDPCSDFAYGEVEQYKLNVVPAGTASVSNATKNSIAAYPNPFTDIIRFTDVKGVQSISVTDVSGRLIKTLAPSTEINLSSLKAGLYILTLKMEDGTVKSIKAIKK